MRKQDELLVLYPHQDRFNKKYILTEIDGLSRTFDSDELLELLRREVGSNDPILAHQAFFGLTLFLPGFIARRFGVAPTEQGLWSRYEAGAAGSAKSVITAALERDRAREFIYAKLEPIAQALFRSMDHGAPGLRKLGRLALAQYPYRSLQDSLLQASVREPDFELTMALARMGSGVEDPAGLGTKVRVEAARQASAHLALVALPATDLAREVSDLAPRVGRLGRANLAITISKHRDPAVLPGIQALTRFQESWVDVYAMRALQGVGATDAADQILRLYERHDNSFVRCQAIRALGGLGGRASFDFLMARTRDADPSIQAQALESLIRLRCPRTDLVKVAEPLRNSSSLRAQVNAWMATLDPREAKKPAFFTDLAQHAEPLHRLEGAYALGYWQSAESAQLLRRLALEDSEDSVRLQAVKSLSRFPATWVAAPLLEVLGRSQGRVAIGVSRVLMRYESESAKVVIRASLEALRGSKTALEAALLMRTMGSLAGKAGSEDAEKVLARSLESPDSRVVHAALEGWKLHGTARYCDIGQKVDELAGSSDHDIAVAALTVKLLHARWDAVDQLADRLSRPAGEGWARAVEAALEWGLLASEVIPRGRFEALAPPAASAAPSRPAIGPGWVPPGTSAPVEDREDGLPFHAPEASPPGPGPETVPPPVSPSSGTPRARVSARTPERPRRQDLVEDILRSTYLLGKRVADPGLEGEARFLHLPPALRAPASFLWMNRWLLPIPILVILLVGYQVVFGRADEGRGRGGSSAAAAAPHALTILHVEGRSTIVGERRPSAGSGLAVGDELTLEEASLVRLRSMLGSELRATGPGRIRAAEANREEAKLEIELETKESLLRADPGETVHVRRGDLRLTMTDAEIRLAHDGSATTLEVRSGSVQVHEAGGGAPRTLATGAKETLGGAIR